MMFNNLALYIMPTITMFHRPVLNLNIKIFILLNDYHVFQPHRAFEFCVCDCDACSEVHWETHLQGNRIWINLLDMNTNSSLNWYKRIWNTQKVCKRYWLVVTSKDAKHGWMPIEITTKKDSLCYRTLVLLSLDHPLLIHNFDCTPHTPS